MARTPKIAVILTDSNRKIIWANADFTQITGYTLSEVVGKKPSLLQGPKSEPDAILRIRRGLKKKVSIKEQITNYRKNGEVYLCKLVIHPVFDDDQQLTNFIAFEVDGDVVKNDAEIPLMQLPSKYQSSSLKGLEEIRLFDELRKTIENDQLYLDPNLSLKIIADRISTNTKYLSQVVNNHANCNFQQFINTYRIKEAKAKMTSDNYQNLTLYGIAMQCGFKNKSTFYKVFKDLTGLTPREYIKAQSAES